MATYVYLDALCTRLSWLLFIAHRFTLPRLPDHCFSHMPSQWPQRFQCTACCSMDISWTVSIMRNFQITQLNETGIELHFSIKLIEAIQIHILIPNKFHTTSWIGHLNVSVYLLFICFKSFLSWKFESGFHWYFHCVHSFDANEHFQSSEWLNSKKFAIWITIFRHNSLPFEWKSEIKGDLYQILSAPFTIWAIFDTNQFSLVRKILIFSKTNLLTTNQLKYCQLLSMAHFLLNESNFMSIAFHVWLIKSIYWQSFYSIFIFILWNYCSDKRMERKWWTVMP